MRQTTESGTLQELLNSLHLKFIGNIYRDYLNEMQVWSWGLQ